jgi:hypothetical protein
LLMKNKLTLLHQARRGKRLSLPLWSSSKMMRMKLRKSISPPTSLLSRKKRRRNQLLLTAAPLPPLQPLARKPALTECMIKKWKNIWIMLIRT